MACCTCCVCIGGVNYTKACSACGSNSLSMSTVNANPSVSQTVRGSCGGASCLSNSLNAIGKWGTVLLATAQGKPVAASGVAVGAKGATTLCNFTNNPTMLIVIVAIIGLLIFFAMQR